MGWFKKKTDPISDRTKAINAQIAALEAQIKRLDSHPSEPPPANQERAPGSRADPKKSLKESAPARDPIFERVDHRHLKSDPDETPQADHFNDLGVRKYDLAAAWRRWRSQFQAPPASNPKLVTYLAAGSIKGLRPLRYEKRVARNRFIALFCILVLVLWGIVYGFIHR